MGKSKDYKWSSGPPTFYHEITNIFYGKEVEATMGITLFFKVSTSDIYDVKYDQDYQNKKGQ